MTTIMNNNVSVNEFNGTNGTNGTNDPTNILTGIENGVCTIKCVASTSSIDSSGDYRITRRLECLWTNQGMNAGDKILDLDISGSKGSTPVVTVNGQVIPSNSLALDPAGNLEVRSTGGMLLDIVKIPNEYCMSPAGIDAQYFKADSFSNTAPIASDVKPFLGIAVRPVSADLAHNLAIDPRNVCVISEVVPGSPACAAGLEPNDVLLGINGKQANVSALRHELETAKPGQSVKLIFLCKGVKNAVTVTLGAFGWKASQTQFKSGFNHPADAPSTFETQGFAPTGAKFNFGAGNEHPAYSGQEASAGGTWTYAKALI